MQDIALRCRCGTVRGVAANVDRNTGNHVICYCGDCQAFPHFLERTDVMDGHGGTAIFQMPPSQMKLSEGVGEVRCMRLSEKGMFRWYAACCNTPLANTLSVRVPFVGVHGAFLALDDHARDDVLGKRVGVNARSAGRVVPGAHDTAPPAMMFRVVRMLLGWWLSGKGRPSPFFDAVGRPLVVPRVLTRDERTRLREKVARIA